MLVSDINSAGISENDPGECVAMHLLIVITLWQGPLLITWSNFNHSMDK